MNGPDDAPLSRTRLVLGDAATDALAQLKIAIFGVGGVGSWCDEALVRTGARCLALIDSDSVEPSNLNRQLEATNATLGVPKTVAMKTRLLEIAPDAVISAIDMRYCEETAGGFRLEDFDCVIDAIDSVDCKALLIANALAIPSVTLFSSMGAARRRNPLLVRTSKFAKVEGDGLAKALRNRFRKSVGMPERNFLCVHSTERPESSGKGSLAQVTGVFGLTLCALVVEEAARRAMVLAQEDTPPA